MINEAYLNEVTENFLAVRKRIDEARKNSPYGQDVTLVAATKTVPAEVINFAARNLGLTVIGENRVQELLSKYDELDKNIKIHFIGTLQRNKVKYIIDKVSLIESVDSISLAEEIDKQAKKRDIVMDVLIEVNIGSEESKGGIFPHEVNDFLDKIKDLSNIRVKGIMTIAPKCEKMSDYCKYFAETYKIFIDISGKKLHNRNISIISMGMSDSFEAAIMCGSNEVRIGSALFGKRK